jgi:hypothetical protein
MEQTLEHRRWIIALSAFTALSALGGSFEMLLWQHGNQYLPLWLLQHTPFQSFLIPGLLLGLVVGGLALLSTFLTWRHPTIAADVILLSGGALSIWIIAELALLRELSWLHAIYGSLGAALLWFGVSASWRTSPRHRWVIGVSLAEMLGFLLPASMGAITALAGVEGVTQFMLLVLAGCGEGLLLGYGQSRMMPLQLSRWRFTWKTAIGAGLAWLCIMSAMMLMQRETSAVMIPLILVLVVTGFFSIGVIQWTELKTRSDKASQWIFWTALAWLVALPISFAPSPLVDEKTPVSSLVVLWGCSGLMMAYVMATITWIGAKRLTER